MNTHRLQNLFSPYLEEGETLICAVFGYQKTGAFKKPSYIGISNRALIVLPIRFNIPYKTFRIPFKNDNCVNIVEHKSAHGRKFDISVTVEKGTDTYNFSVFSHSKRLKEQIENTILFIKNIKMRFRYTFTPDKKKISDKAIRIQYCDGLLRFAFSFFGAIFISCILVAILKGQSLALTLEGLAPVGKGIVYLCTPIIIAKILNRFFLGKVIGKTHKDKVVVNNNSFQYDRIEKVVFSPADKISHHLANSCAYFYVKNQYGTVKEFRIYGFPAYSIWEIKKHEPNTKIVLPLFSKIFLFIEFVAAPVGLILYGLIKF